MSSSLMNLSPDDPNRPYDPETPIVFTDDESDGGGGGQEDDFSSAESPPPSPYLNGTRTHTHTHTYTYNGYF